MPQTTTAAPSPTDEAYDPLKAAYDLFNARLFGGRLPGCIITYQRQARTYGYFSGQRWDSAGGRLCDEIAMNPGYFKVRSPEDLLSTLVHEMVHQCQECFGKPSRRTYHNKEWARMMKDVGLQPSDTGEPGGKETGQQMSHFIVPGGPFDRACRELLESGFTFVWSDRAAIGGEDDDAEGSSTKRRKNKIKYTCAACGLNVWGKPELRIGCLDCATPFLAAG